MATREVEARPAFSTPPHFLDPSRTLAVWLTEPPGMVAQFMRRGPFTVALAQWLAGEARERMLARFSDNQTLVLVLDLTLMDGREPSSRPVIVEAARALAPRTRRAAIVPPAGASRVYLASVQAAASIARVFGLTVVVVESLDAALRSLSAATPRA